MLRIKKILVPSDFTSCADFGFAVAVQMAELFGAEVHVLHAVVGHKQSLAEVGVSFPVNETDLAEQLHLARMASAYDMPSGALPVIIQARVQDAMAELAILDYADRHGIDLIAMGTHGRTGFDHWFSGSVAERVVRYASCPVVTIRESAVPPPRGRIERILVPADLTERSHDTLTCAGKLAAVSGAQVHVLHVIESGPAPGAPPAEEAAEHAWIEQALQVQMWSAGIDPANGAIEVVPGHADTTIVDVAHQLRPDLMVISKHGRTGVGRLMLGSVAEKIVRLAPCPVLTVMAPQTPRTRERATPREPWLDCSTLRPVIAGA